MKRKLRVLMLLGWLGGTLVPLRAQRDFLTAQEVDSLRDAQEPRKRITLYLDFAQRRLDAVKQQLSSPEGGEGHAMQKNLAEYIRILEAVEGTIRDAREDRTPLEKALEEVSKRVPEFLRFLQPMESQSSPSWEDYRFTLEEAITITREVVELAKEGSFPEVQEREPPSGLPPKPPPPPPGDPKESAR